MQLDTTVTSRLLWPVSGQTRDRSYINEKNFVMNLPSTNTIARSYPSVAGATPRSLAQ
jgi:hypothetical protein